jgi:hypothetical protein
LRLSPGAVLWSTPSVVEPSGGLVRVGAAVDRPQFLGGDPGGGDLTAIVVGLDGAQQPRSGVLGEDLRAAA